MLWTAVTLETKDFSARLGRFRPKTCGHTPRRRALAVARRHEVSVGGWRRLMAGTATHQKVELSYSLISQNEGAVANQIEKAFAFRA